MVWTSAGLQQRPAGRKISGPFLLSEEEAGVPRLIDSHTSRSDPSGLVVRKPSGIPSAAIMRSQGFSQFQLSFPTESRWVPAPSVSGRAEPWHTGTGENSRPAVFPQRAFGFTRQRWEKGSARSVGSWAGTELRRCIFEVETSAVRGEFHNAGGLILGEHYSRLCAISFSHAASNSSRLAILAQRGGAQALLSRARCVS